MTKHALEAMGKAMRAELAPQGIDVTLLNPGPYLTGFNDRMADSMWEWFGEGSLNAPATPMFQMMREFVTNGQMDPAEVVTRMVELTEAETTTENNFVPPEHPRPDERRPAELTARRERSACGTSGAPEAGRTTEVARAIEGRRSQRHEKRSIARRLRRAQAGER